MVDLPQEMKLLAMVAILRQHPIFFQSFLMGSLCSKSSHQWVQEVHYDQIVFQIQQALINPQLELVLTGYVGKFALKGPTKCVSTPKIHICKFLI
jgi:hypothetical protein